MNTDNLFNQIVNITNQHSKAILEKVDKEREERQAQARETASHAPKHTPGPWKVGYVSNADNSIAISDGTKLSPLAYVQPRPFYDDNQIANANLIASAPELISLLKDLAEIYEFKMGGGYCQSKTLELIAKAERSNS